MDDVAQAKKKGTLACVSVTGSVSSIDGVVGEVYKRTQGTRVKMGDQYQSFIAK